MSGNRVFLLITKIIAIGFVVFHLYTAAIGMMIPLQQRSIHVIFALVLTFALVPTSGKEGSRTKITVWDFFLIGLTLLSAGYIAVNTKELLMRGVALGTVREAFLGALLILLTLEAGRRRIGLAFPVLVTVAILYTLLGQYIPGKWGHFPIRPLFMLQSIYLSDVGIWGIITGVSSTLIALFIIFGAFLVFTEGGDTFIAIALIVSGRMWGGAAKVATVASAFFGMISGSAIANTAGTGNFTIPLMKKLGYKPEFAGAVEATASTGGIFTPPIMGSTAFLLAEFTGTPYLRVMASAIIPAFLFFFGVFFSVDSHARKQNLAPVPRELIPSPRSVLTWNKLAPIVIPVGVLVGLLMSGKSAFFASFWGCVAVLVMYNITISSFSEIKPRLLKTLEGMDKAGRSLATIVPLMVCASIVVALINMTGVGIKLSELIMGLGGTSILLALILGAIVAIILGMGVPTNAAYVLCAAVVAPGLVKLGVPLFAAHMFVMYFACISGITPPVCPNVFVASAIAQSDWVKTGWQSVRFAFIIYIIPFIFVYDTALLMEGPIGGILFTFATALWATFLITIGFGGYFLVKTGLMIRSLFFVSGFLLLMPHLQITIGGAVLSVIAMLMLLWRNHKSHRMDQQFPQIA